MISGAPRGGRGLKPSFWNSKNNVILLKEKIMLFFEFQKEGFNCEFYSYKFVDIKQFVTLCHIYFLLNNHLSCG